MRRLILLLAVLLSTATAYADPVITSITPDEGSEFGGTEVVIRGSGFTVCQTCDATTTLPQVWFGDRPSGTIGWIDSTELRVWTPEHPPGTVPVTVRQVESGVTRSTTRADAFTFTEEAFKMTPRSGPQSGGTLVTITGAFGSWPYDVVFGDQFVPGFRVNETTLVAVTPPGSGQVPVRIFEYDVYIDTNIVFTYVHGPADDQERILLPLLTPPVNGAGGSRFHTELRAINRIDWEPTDIFGLAPSCSGNCQPPSYEANPITLLPRGELLPVHVAYDGGPGRFLWVAKNAADRLWLNLRVYDSTRSANNFGTELPVVRERDFFRDMPIFFSGVPTDPQFRTTLRIYATAPTTITVVVDAAGSPKETKVTLRPGMNLVDPAYAQFSDFPSNVGEIRVALTPPAPGQAGFATPYWAFLSVTNNDTQFITTIRP